MGALLSQQRSHATLDRLAHAQSPAQLLCVVLMFVPELPSEYGSGFLRPDDKTDFWGVSLLLCHPRLNV